MLGIVNAAGTNEICLNSTVVSALPTCSISRTHQESDLLHADCNHERGYSKSVASWHLAIGKKSNMHSFA
jgi:hypothetical protein